MHQSAGQEVSSTLKSLRSTQLLDQTSSISNCGSQNGVNKCNHVCNPDIPKLRDNRFHCVIHFFLEPTDIRTRVRVGAVRNITPNILLVNVFNARYIKARYPMGGLVRLIGWRAAPILATRNDTLALISTPQAPKPTRVDSSLVDNNYDIRTARCLKIPPNSQCFVPVMTEARGRILMEPSPELLNRYRGLATKRNSTIHRNDAICILVANFYNERLHLLKNMKSVIGTPAPDRMYESKFHSYEDDKTPRKCRLQFSLVVSVLNLHKSIP